MSTRKHVLGAVARLVTGLIIVAYGSSQVLDGSLVFGTFICGFGGVLIGYNLAVLETIASVERLFK